ncbi:MAG: ChaN family lipoprotein, partial [Planctomycetes bacterium]|nr:ChaN family lipoprotein [Planctomycetota bacterium]
MSKVLVAAFLLFLLAGCVAPARIIATATDSVATIEGVAADLAGADVVALGELHGVQAVHRTHHQLVEALHALRPNMVIAMEMFERDVQTSLLQYLTGAISEAEFLAASRPWQRYARDYRPIIEFARLHHITVLAANAPRELAIEAKNLGVERVLGSPYLARSTTAPEDPYWDAFVDSMKGHAGLDGVGAMQRFYAAQCLKDDTMAESIVDYLRQHSGNPPLVVLICGRLHSDHGRGTVQRIRSRLPGVDVRVVSAELVEDLASNSYSTTRDVADYVIVTPDPEGHGPQAEITLTRPEAMGPGADGPAAAKSESAGGPPPRAPGADQEERPALGITPDYGRGEAGLCVGDVRPGGPAEAAG